MANEELRVEIIQQFEDTTPDLQTPILRTVLIGDHFQVEENKILGTFSGVGASLAYPNLTLGAAVDLTSVVVSIVDSDGTFVLADGTESIPGAATVAIAATGAFTPATPGASLMRRAITRVSSSTGAGVSGVVAAGTANFSDPNINFITRGVVASDQMVIAAPSPNAGTFYVQVIDANSVELFTDTALTAKAVLVADTDDDTYTVVNDHALSGALLIDYIARRNDLVGQLRLINRQQEVDTVAGPADVRNPLGLAANLVNTASPGVAFYVTALATNDVSGHASALDLLESENTYALVPLIQNTEDLDVVTLYEQHVSEESKPENGRFRVALLSRDVPTVLERVPATALALIDGDFDTGTGPNEMDLTDANGDFLADGVAPGDLLTVSGSDVIPQNGTFLIKAVTPTVITAVGTLGGPNTVPITYEVNSQALTLTDQSEFMKDYAESVGNRRIVNIVAGRGQVKTIFTGDTWVPSFYVGASIAGLVSFLPPQQGLSRITVPGISDIRSPVLGKFRREDLNTIGSGGNFIVEKPTEGSLVRVRRQRTTSTISLEEAELSITKDIDYVSFFVAGALEPFLGQFNIVDSFFSMAQATLDTVRFNLTSGSHPGIGPVLLKFEVISFKPAETEKGTVLLVIDVEPPFPVNIIRVTLVI
jgi:hypothetical protein